MLLFNIPWDLLLLTLPAVWVTNRVFIPYQVNNLAFNLLACAKCVGLWLGLAISIGYFYGNIQENFESVIAFSVWNSLLSYILALVVYIFERFAGQ